jgi:hypothetical protein
VLWLEDLGDGDGGGWSLERYSLVARGLGQFGGACAGNRPVPDWPWLSRGWLASWVEQAAAGFEVFADAVRDPLLARLYPPQVAAVMVELWQARGRICAAAPLEAACSIGEAHRSPELKPVGTLVA